MHHVSPTSKHNAHGADDALRNLNSATAKNDLLPPVSQRSQESSPFIALGDDLRRVRQEQPVPNAAHSLHYKHICRKTVATRCVSQGEILYRLGLQTWVTDLGGRASSSANSRAMPRSSPRQTGGRSAANRDELAAQSSLPVPDSPGSRTVVSVAVQRLPSSSTRSTMPRCE